jgi:hypothetical protein
MHEVRQNTTYYVLSSNYYSRDNYSSRMTRKYKVGLQDTFHKVQNSSAAVSWQRKQDLKYQLKAKAKAFSPHAMKALGGRGSILVDPTHS